MLLIYHPREVCCKLLLSLNNYLIIHSQCKTILSDFRMPYIIFIPLTLFSSITLIYFHLWPPHSPSTIYRSFAKFSTTQAHLRRLYLNDFDDTDSPGTKNNRNFENFIGYNIWKGGTTLLSLEFWWFTQFTIFPFLMYPYVIIFLPLVFLPSLSHLHSLDSWIVIPTEIRLAAQKHQKEHVRETIEKTKIVLLSKVTSEDELLDDSDEEYSLYDYENQPLDDLSSGGVISGTV